MLIVTYVFRFKKFMLIPKKFGVIFVDHRKVIFRPLEVTIPWILS